jgi:hypothetical protein
MSRHEVTDHEQTTAREPSSRVWASALAGLLGVGGAACGDEHHHVDPDPDPIDAPAVDAATDAGIDAPTDATPSKIISETVVQHSFAELRAMCDQRGGYIEIYASCSGSNTCAGFSYGDWGDGATLIEHSCNAVSGCNGLGCVVLPADSGMSALDILEAELPDTEGVAQRSCNYCHAEWSEDFSTFDATKFKVHVVPGSGRTLATWLERTPEQMARIIAFGSHGQYADGTQYSHMQGYYKMYSRAEIERVVDYVRTTATPVLHDIKVNDPPMPLQLRRRIALPPGTRPRAIRP